MLKVTVNQDGLTTGQMLELMELQGRLQSENSAGALRQMIELLQTSIMRIEYDGRELPALLDVPFVQLRPAMEQIMRQLNGTDPN